MAAVGTAAVLASVTGFSPGRGASEEVGRTSAVLSFIDAEAGGVEVVRHWPEAPSDVTVYPFVPYFWDACPGGVLVRAADWYTSFPAVTVSLTCTGLGFPQDQDNLFLIGEATFSHGCLLGGYVFALKGGSLI